MKRFHSFSALSAAMVFGAVAMASQTLLLRRFLWRFESAETGVALFLSCWLFWSGMGAALTCTPFGRKTTGFLSRAVWPLIAACALLYFAQYALIGNIRGWMGVPAYESFPLLHLALGCFVANAPFGLVAGLVVPALCRRLADLGASVSRAFAWEALGAAAGGFGVTLLLAYGTAPDPRDESEWFTCFPQATERPGRFETGGGTTFYGSHGGTFYALSSGGVSEVIPEGDRSMDVAALLLSQRPYAQRALLLGQVPLSVGLALEALRPDLSIVWCPCDAQYGVHLLNVLREGGLQTGIGAAGATPQRLLERQPDASFDCVLAVPPPATTLEGAGWRLGAFAQSVRRVTRRTGIALFGLACETAALTPEKSALLDVYVNAVRQVWPESGVFAAGAGGWWVAAQVPKLAYEADAAAARFALLKRDVYPAAAIPLLYDPQRAQGLAQQCSALNPDRPELLPATTCAEDVLALGLADALRRGYPMRAPGAWLDRMRTLDGARVLGMLLVALWMFPVACGGRFHASRRLTAAWLAACGALGLVVSLSVLYRLQMRFGSLYLLAGVGSCLYLAGLFCGNRIGDLLVWVIRARPAGLCGVAVSLTALQAGLALCILSWTEMMPTAICLVSLCFVAGCAAGGSVPMALAVCEGDSTRAASVFILADAVGASVGGLFFVLLVPLGGLHGALTCYAVLACGTALCMALGRHHARLTAGLAFVVALAIVGGHLRDTWQPGVPRLLPDDSETDEPFAPVEKRAVTNVVGIPRKVDVEVIRKQMQAGTLATNTAVFWQKE